MTYLLAFGAILCGWALLSVLGGERERRLRDLEAEQATRPTDSPDAAAANPKRQ